MTDLIDRWQARGCPEIPLSPGVVIVDLVRWLNPFGWPAERPEAELAIVREALENTTKQEVMA